MFNAPETAERPTKSEEVANGAVPLSVTQSSYTLQWRLALAAVSLGILVRLDDIPFGTRGRLPVLSNNIQLGSAVRELN